MVHNGIEYGVMQAYAEGFDILRNVNSPAVPENRRYKLNLARRRRGLAARQRDLVVAARSDRDRAGRRSRAIANLPGRSRISGEGRWTIQAAIEEAVPAEVLSSALYTRFRSRQDHTFAEHILSAMRNEFGGHQEPGTMAKD